MNFQQAIDEINKFLDQRFIDFINSESEDFIPFYLENILSGGAWRAAFPDWSMKTGFRGHPYKKHAKGYKEVSVITFLKSINDFKDFSEKERLDKISDTIWKFKCEVFRQIEMKLDWPEEYSNFIVGSGDEEILLDILKLSMRERSLNDGISEGEYYTRTNDLKSFFNDLKWAFKSRDDYINSYYDDKVSKTTENNKNGKTKSRPWIHRHDVSEKYKDETYEINKIMLFEAAYKYSEAQWLHHPDIDYMFLDALVYLELSSFRDDFIAGRLGGDDSFIVLDWYKAEGDFGKFTKKKAALDKPMWFGKTIMEYVGLDIISPLIIALTFFYFSKILGVVFATFYVSLLIGMNEKERDEIKNCKERLLFLRMYHNLYKIFKQDPIDLNHLKSVATTYSSQTTGYLYSGICLEPIFHVILTKAIKENPDGILYLL